jgi:acyl carrier protein
MHGLTALLTGSIPQNYREVLPAAPQRLAAAAPVLAAAPALAPASAPAPVPAQAARPVSPAAVLAVAPGLAPAPAPAVSSPKAAASPALSTVDLQALLITIVAEKTGYPPEMLTPTMELEADLGIDSIKRVEILSAMRERAPGLPEVKPTELAALRTLGEIAAYMGAQASAAAPQSHVAHTPPVAPVASLPAAASLPNLEVLLIQIVAEKTGYPAEMLVPTMELEADLGIDSIKRVEILSAMRERAPGLPEVKPTELAALRTLGEIAAYMGKHAGGAQPNNAAGPVTAAAASPTTAAAPLDIEALGALLITIVAEKTGYPANMLAPTMELEADLGIDSIKRVEILSAMRERAPGLPEVKPTELAALRTLGEIAAYMGSRGPAAAPATAAQASPQMQAAPSSAKAAIHRYAVRAVLAPATGMVFGGVLAAKKLVITRDDAGVAEALHKQLQAAGIASQLADVVPQGADGVIFLGGLRNVKNEEAAIAVNREAFRAARALATSELGDIATLVTVQDTGGDFGLSGANPTQAWLGGLAALTRTAAREWPSAHLKAIDCERSGRSAEVIAAAIANELMLGGATLDVGLSGNGTRSTLEMVDSEAHATTHLALTAESVVVVSGGGRGVTAACVIEIARARKCRFVLLGRSALVDIAPELLGCVTESDLKRTIIARAQAQGQMPKPADVASEAAQILATREVQATLAAVQAAGGQAKYVVADVQDKRAVDSALAAVRADWGPIQVVIHGAGVLADKLLHEKTDAQFDRVFDTKLRGLQALLAATAQDPLSALCLFSSIAARTGNLGQSDYAMANEILNQVACAEQRRRGERCAVRAIGWGPWEGGMVTPTLKKHFEQLGVALIPLDVGASMLARELEYAGPDSVIVVSGPAGEGPLGAGPSGGGSKGPAAGTGGRANGGKSQPTALQLGGGELRVHQSTHSYLADHAIGAAVVAPLVMATEWMVQAASSVVAGMHVVAVRNLRVMRGIRLDAFAEAGDNFTLPTTVVASAARATSVGVELRGPKGQLHYSAIVDFALDAPFTPRATAADLGALEAWPHGALYDGVVLFHGPRFQVIRQVGGVSQRGLAGVLSGALDVGWQESAQVAWCTDPALLDGALQLAVLHARYLLGGAALPMALGELRLFGTGLLRGPVAAQVVVHEVRESRAVCTVQLANVAGDVIAELCGLELVLRPDVVLPVSSAAHAGQPGGSHHALTA